METVGGVVDGEVVEDVGGGGAVDLEEGDVLVVAGIVREVDDQVLPGGGGAQAYRVVELVSGEVVGVAHRAHFHPALAETAVGPEVEHHRVQRDAGIKHRGDGCRGAGRRVVEVEGVRTAVGGAAVATDHTLGVGSITAPAGDEGGAVNGDDIVEVVEVGQLGDRAAFGSGDGSRPVAHITAAAGTDTEVVAGVGVKAGHLVGMCIGSAATGPSGVVCGILNLPSAFAVAGSPVQRDACGAGLRDIHVRSHTRGVVVAVTAEDDIASVGAAA